MLRAYSNQPLRRSANPCNASNIRRIRFFRTPITAQIFSAYKILQTFTQLITLNYSLIKLLLRIIICEFGLRIFATDPWRTNQHTLSTLTSPSEILLIYNYQPQRHQRSSDYMLKLFFKVWFDTIWIGIHVEERELLNYYEITHGY